MSQFVRPRRPFNEQVCHKTDINVGEDVYGLAYQKPNNPLYFTLENLKYGVAKGSFMKNTPTGTSLPNPVNSMKELIKPPGNPPPPRLAPGNNSYVIRGNENNPMNQQVRREARQEIREQMRGMMGVTRTPNVMRREVAYQAAVSSNLRRANRSIARLRGESIVRSNPLRTPTKAVPRTPELNTEERQAFTWSPFVDSDAESAGGVEESKGGEQYDEDQTATPATRPVNRDTPITRSARRRRRPRRGPRGLAPRRRLVKDEKEDNTGRLYEQTQVQQVLNEEDE